MRKILLSVLCSFLFFGSVKAEEFSPMIQDRIIAAKNGNVKAQYFLGNLFYNGYQVKRDCFTAYQLFLLAAKQGHTDAQDKLGEMLAEGKSIHADNIQQDDVQAVKWFRIAATLGHAQAAAHLGAMYELGRGVERSPTEAKRWCQLAVQNEQNDNVKNIYKTFYQNLENMGY